MKTRRSMATLGSGILGIALIGSAPAYAAPEVSGASPQAGNSIRIIASGVSAKGGWVEFSGTGTVKIDGTTQTIGTTAARIAAETKEVGGGIWYYGASVNGGGQKTCTSQYYHGNLTHGSSVKMNGMTDSDDVGPGDVSMANVTGWTDATCYAYWRTS